MSKEKIGVRNQIKKLPLAHSACQVERQNLACNWRNVILVVHANCTEAFCSQSLNEIGGATEELETKGCA